MERFNENCKAIQDELSIHGLALYYGTMSKDRLISWAKFWSKSKRVTAASHMTAIRAELAKFPLA